MNARFAKVNTSADRFSSSLPRRRSRTTTDLSSSTRSKNEVDIAVRTLDEELMAYVEGVVEMERRERTLQQTEEELRKNADIAVDEATLYRILVPVW